MTTKAIGDSYTPSEIRSFPSSGWTFEGVLVQVKGGARGMLGEISEPQAQGLRAELARRREAGELDVTLRQLTGTTVYVHVKHVSGPILSGVISIEGAG